MKTTPPAMAMYQEQILDHYRHPRNQGELPSPAVHTHSANPLCGDELDFFVEFDAHDKVTKATFIGRGCTITIASASMLTEKLKGMSRAAVAELNKEDILAMLGVTINPARLKCATLSLEAAQQAIQPNTHA